MQAKLLAKIEELTLHMIQADEKNRELQTRIAQLEARGVPPGH
jgi:BMFP domain-containing protein YqiC